jgi:hypothetical protein
LPADVQELSAEAFLRMAARRWAHSGACSVIIDIRSDCYPLAFHAMDHDAEVAELTKRCRAAGFGELRRA